MSEVEELEVLSDGSIEGNGGWGALSETAFSMARTLMDMDTSF